jgi:PAS domain-containing protein
VVLEIYDGSRLVPETLLFSDEPGWNAPSPSSRATFQATSTVRVNRRPWTLRFSARPGFGTAFAQPLPALVTVGGLCITLLVFGIVRSVTGSHEQALALANRMTAGLRLQERALTSSNDGVFILDAKAQGYPMIYANPAFEQLTGYSLEECNNQKTTLLSPADAIRPNLPP